MQLKIADRIKNNILPSTLGLFDIVTEYVDNIPITKIIISGGLEKPYYIKSKGMSPNGCYMRLGTSTQPMPTALIDELYAKRIHTTLRNIPAPRQDLTFAQLKIYYQESGFELNRKFVNSLELLTPDGKYNYIGYLLADENGVSIKVAKYAGITKVDLIENEEYGYCSLIKAMNHVLEKMKIENVTKTKVTSTKRVEKNLVETVPLREALINAIVHNDFSREIPPVFEIFSDRIEITSYGGLIPGQSEEHFIKVVFPFSISINGDINGDINDDKNSDISKVILLLEKEPDITEKKISEQTGLSTRKISRIIRELRESGIIIRKGSNKKGYWEINKSKNQQQNRRQTTL